MSNWVEPKVGQVWKDIDRDILFLITEIKDGAHCPVKVLMNKKSNIFGKISDSQYSMTYMKNLCEYQGESQVDLDKLFLTV